MADGLLPPVVATLVADIKEFSAKMEQAKGEMDSLEKKGASTSSVLTKGFGSLALGAGGLALGIGTVAAMLGEKFQSAVAGVSGQLELSHKATKSFSDEMMSLSSNSEFSATQLVQAYSTVARQVTLLSGGQNLAKASSDVLRASMELSVATNTDLSTSTGAIVTIMKAFNEPVSAASKTMGQLYNTSTLTGVSTDQLATSIARMHSRIGVATPTVGAIGGLMLELSKNGISGSRAMLTTSTAIEKLLAPSKTAVKQFGDLSTELYDSNGKFVGMKNAIAVLQPMFEGMTQQQQLASATTLFGAGAAQTMLKVIQAGPAAYEKATKAINDQKRAHEAAAKQAQTFHGELKRLTATADNLGTQLGLALLPNLQKVMEWINTKGLQDIKNFMAGFDGKKATGWAADIGRALKTVSRDFENIFKGIIRVWNDIPAGLRPIIAGAGVGAVGGSRFGPEGAVGGAIAGAGAGALHTETQPTSNPLMQWFDAAGWGTISTLFKRGPFQMYHDIFSGGSSSGTSSRTSSSDPAIKAGIGTTATNTGNTSTNVSQVHQTLMQHSAYLQQTQSATNYTSQHTRLANSQLDAIHGALKQKDKVSITVRMK